MCSVIACEIVLWDNWSGLVVWNQAKKTFYFFSSIQSFQQFPPKGKWKKGIGSKAFKLCPLHTKHIYPLLLLGLLHKKCVDTFIRQLLSGGRSPTDDQCWQRLWTGCRSKGHSNLACSILVCRAELRWFLFEKEQHDKATFFYTRPRVHLEPWHT